MKELIGGPGPKVLPNKVDLRREDLRVDYARLLIQNPLLGRMEGEMKIINWSDEEIRTAQLLIACASNASLKKRVEELEAMLGQQTQRRGHA